MKTPRILLLSVFLCGLFMVPAQTQAQVPVNEAAYRAVLIELIQALQQQIILLKAELEAQQIVVVPVNENHTSFSDSLEVIAYYNTSKVADVSQISKRSHREYFERVFELFPSKYDKQIKRLAVFDGNSTEFDAFVETLPPKHEYWQFSVNEEIINDEDSDSNTELIVHELAHIISYEEISGVPRPAQTTCAEYFSVHGCPAKNSYLSQFVDKFWSDSDLSRASQFAEAADPLEEAYSYYDKHENEFVTDYAASSPEEDFSESFMYFVLGESVKRKTIASQKVDFFNQYLYLLEVQNEIRENQ